MAMDLRIICTTLMVVSVFVGASTEGRAQEVWTGFSVSVGGNAEILSAGVNSQASWTDDLGICLDESCEGAGITRRRPRSISLVSV